MGVDDDSLEDVKTDLAILSSSTAEAIIKLGFYIFGSSLAMVISYFNNHSILWAIGHGILSWAYVLYFAIFK